MKLTETEELLMEMIWQKDKIFMKELLETYPEPKPAATTVATLLKRMIDKGFVAYREFGNSREYYPLVSKDVYFGKHINGLIKNFFGDSSAQFASFFTQQSQLSTEELQALKQIIENQIQKQKS